MNMKVLDPSIDALVSLALAEDIGSGDITTRKLVDPAAQGRARIIAKEPLTVAGAGVVELVFTTLSPGICCHFFIADGFAASAGQVIAEIEGPFCALLTGERTALNFLQRLSGIATLTGRYVNELLPYKAKLLDTRKTTPGWRVLEKEAVRLGGGTNHRIGLFDAILIKENHIAACGGISAALANARDRLPPLTSVEIEVKDLEELQEALAAKPDMIMLDNMSIEGMSRAVSIAAGRVPLEASGNVTLDSIARIAETGVDYISCGAITHSCRAVDISMLVDRA